MEIEELNIKFLNILEDRELPKNLKKVIQEIYDECIDFYKDNIENKVRLIGVKEFFEKEYKFAENKITEYYQENCMQKFGNVSQYMYNLDNDLSENLNTNENAEIKLKECLEPDSKSNHFREDRMPSNTEKVDKMEDYIIDVIASFRNKLMSALMDYTVSAEEKEEIDFEINDIKMHVKEKLENEGIEALEVDDKKIEEAILVEYENYIETNKIKQPEEKTASEKFREQYHVAQEDLQPIKTQDLSNTEQQKDNEDKYKKADVELV